jgi:predicted chitinase
MGAIEARATFSNLGAVAGAAPLEQLTKPQLQELQIALSLLGYPIGTIDGLIGPRTRNAWAEFKSDVFPGNPQLIGPESVDRLRQDVLKLAAWEKANFGTKQGAIDAIRGMCQAIGIGLPTQVAYVLATAQWETAQTFQPVKEAFWLSEAWRKANLSYFPYYGRGYVQLTWDKNYKAYSDILGIDMVATPDLALDPTVALFVIAHGFKTGTFTGRKITDFITQGTTDFVGARRCINGTDKANEIAKLAQSFLGGSVSV